MDFSLIKSSCYDIDQRKDYQNYFSDSNMSEFLNKYKKNRKSIRKLWHDKNFSADNSKKLGYSFTNRENSVKSCVTNKRSKKNLQAASNKGFFSLSERKKQMSFLDLVKALKEKELAKKPKEKINTKIFFKKK